MKALMPAALLLASACAQRGPLPDLAPPVPKPLLVRCGEKLCVQGAPDGPLGPPIEPIADARTSAVDGRGAVHAFGWNECRHENYQVLCSGPWHARWDGAAWKRSPLEEFPDFLATPPDGALHALFVDRTGRVTHGMQDGGDWTFAEIADLAAEGAWVHATDYLFDERGHHAAAIARRVDGRVEHFLAEHGSRGWRIERVHSDSYGDDGNSQALLAYDGAGAPHVLLTVGVYEHGRHRGLLLHAHHTSDGWEIEPIDEFPLEAHLERLVALPDGTLAAEYVGYSASHIPGRQRRAVLTDGAWHVEDRG